MFVNVSVWFLFGFTWKTKPRVLRDRSCVTRLMHQEVDFTKSMSSILRIFTCMWWNHLRTLLIGIIFSRFTHGCPCGCVARNFWKLIIKSKRTTEVVSRILRTERPHRLKISWFANVLSLWNSLVSFHFLSCLLKLWRLRFTWTVIIHLLFLFYSSYHSSYRKGENWQLKNSFSNDRSHGHHVQDWKCISGKLSSDDADTSWTVSTADADSCLGQRILASSHCQISSQPCHALWSKIVKFGSIKFTSHLGTFAGDGPFAGYGRWFLTSTRRSRGKRLVRWVCRGIACRRLFLFVVSIFVCLCDVVTGIEICLQI